MYLVGNSEMSQSYTMSIQMPAGNYQRPRIGELWMGKLTTMLRGADPDIDIKEGDPAQLRVMGASGRQEILSNITRSFSSVLIKIRTFTEAQWNQYKNLLFKGTRYGADPVVVVPPSDLQGSGRVIHGRIGPVIGTKHKDKSWKEFSVDLTESPFASL
jgi:hypothetical protein